MKVLVTGAAGFIGYHVCERLLARGDTVIGLDNLDTSGDVTLKATRLSRLKAAPNFGFHRMDIRDVKSCRELFDGAKPERVVHLAARVGVRAMASEGPDYAETNVTGFLQVLELCRQARVEHLVFASSSSVYGAGTPVPFSEQAPADRPLSLYAATKRADEMMAHVYSHQYGLPVSGLRLFTVYGPWGRPDMAPMLFLRAMLEGRSIVLHGEGKMRRDFTYVDDAVEALVRVLDKPPVGEPPYRVLNVGGGSAVEMARFVDLLEEQLGTKAWVELRPAQPGELDVTCADVTALERETGFRPSMPLEQGVAKLVAWYRGSEG
ncbi:NAD-dependent epimerase/dehydratase family protein [Vitiosangium sp. GDMCC 1.1324]|uniref:NAD-dependent epimerase/dehydratase family protein n=1 Tax=Vitiosangium sp. (strain GDMCC 1.1324) TaxID=2138576 RepID=UPI000D35E865|nr:NAD-dependent epimerase/dehydratase family protein [Vitiosangium sp. GDMCC 1.1324]PTL85589.1 capsular biosynthesis protein CpsI [Vitiosangium sp. GDMCC 1.1324]